jgi:AcrR family transcriptional regulator
MRRSDEAGASRREEILRVATDLFLAEGFAGTSMSALAQACGMQKASLYHHVPSKEALFIACVTEGYDRELDALRAIRDAALTDEERLARAMAELYRITVDSPVGRMSPLIAEVSLRFPEAARAFHDGFIAQEHEIFGAIIARGLANGSFKPHDRLGLEHLIFGPVVTLALSRRMFASHPALEQSFPVARVRDSHTAMVLQLLRAGTAMPHGA